MLLGLALVLASFIWGQIPNNSHSKVHFPPSDSSLIRGKKIYKQYCSGCHGAEMKAFVNWRWKYGSSKTAIYTSIANGRGQGAMPAFGNSFTEQQLKDVTAYLADGFENLARYESKNDQKPDTKDIFETKDFKFHLEPVISNLEIPWGMAFLPNADMLITEKAGRMILLKKDGTPIPIKNVPTVNDAGQGGLLDIELHPNFSENGWIYLSYSKPKPGQKSLRTTAVTRYRLQGNTLVDEELIFEGLPYASTRHHYGSRMEFDKEGYLFISMGDRGSRDVNPQNLEKFSGKIHRLNADGSIPEDNPFVKQKKAAPSVYSYGHRNPQGLAIHPTTGKIWEHEHGPRGGDEINIIEKAQNYGWPVVSYGINYSGTVFTDLTEKAGMQSPIHYWVPSIAPCGMDFVTSDIYPAWKNHLLVGSLRFEYLNLCKIEGEKIIEEEILMKNVGRVRNVRQAPDGYIYVAVERPGRIYKIVPIQ